MAFTLVTNLKRQIIFFVGYEENTKFTGLYGTKDSGAQNPARVVTTALANEIRQFTIDNYGGYDPGYQFGNF